MRKKVIRLISVFVMFVIIFVQTMSVANASDGNDVYIDKDYEIINNSLNYLGYSEEDVIYTEEYKVIDSNGTDKNITFVYTDEELIGEYIKAYNDVLGIEQSCFIVSSDQDVLDVLQTEEDFCIDLEDNSVNIRKLNYAEEKLNIVEKNRPEFFDLNEEVIEYKVDITSYDNWVYEKISEGTAQYITNSAAVGYLVKVGNVYNNKKNGGICWCAAGASIINYVANKNYTALGLYNNIKSATGSDPVGNVSNEQLMFDLFNIKYTYTTRKLKYNNVLSVLSGGSPIMCNMQGISCEDYDVDVYHVIVLCGAFRISQSYGYIYMDPNIESGYVLNYLDLSVIGNNADSRLYYYSGNNFYYKCNGMFYNFCK